MSDAPASTPTETTSDGKDLGWMSDLGIEAPTDQPSAEPGEYDEESSLEERETDPDLDVEEGDNEPAEPDADSKAEVEKWKSLARKHERRAKMNADKAAELDAIKANPAFADLDDQGKALEAVKASAKAEARAFFAERLVSAELRAAAAGTDLDVSALTPTLNHAALLTEDGDVDLDKVTALVNALKPKKTTPKVDLGQGHRGKTKPMTRTDAWGEFFDKNF